VPEQPSRKPWWAAALVGGFGAVLAVLLSFGLVRPGGDAQAQVRTSGVAAAAQEDRDARLNRIESKLDEALQRIAHIEGRMDRK
jgi:hypothetical protein